MAPNATAQDITINIGANIKSVLSKVNQVKASITQMQSQIQSKLGKRTMRNFTTPVERFKKSVQGMGDELKQSLQMQRVSSGKSPKRFLAGTKKELTGINAAVQSTNFRSAGQTLDAINAKTNNIFTASKRAGTGMENLSGDMGKAKEQGRGMGQSFDGAALSLMFFGMQLQRIFGGIIRSGVSTFNTVMGQIEDTTTEANRLAGAFTFFKFEVGQAMQPLLGSLTPIVAKAGELADRFPGLTRKVLTFGAALGGLLIAGGSIRLAQVAFGDLLDRVGGISGAANSALDAINDLSNKNWSGLADKASNLAGPMKKLAGLGAITLSVEFMAQAIDEFVEGDLVAGLIGTLSSVVTSIGGLILAAGGSAVTGGTLLLIGIGLRLIGFQRLANWFHKTMDVLLSLWRATTATMKQNFKENMLTGVQETFNEMFDFILDLDQGLLSFLGIDVSDETVKTTKNLVDNAMGVDDTGKTFSDRVENELRKIKEKHPELYPDYHAKKPDAANADTAQIIGDTLQTPPFQAQGTNQVDLPQGVKDDISTIAEENMRMRKRNEYLNRILRNKEGAFSQAQKYRKMSLPELQQVARGIQETS